MPAMKLPQIRGRSVCQPFPVLPGFLGPNGSYLLLGGLAYRPDRQGD